MSGAEAAIAGVGLLCSAIQIVTFGRDILQVYCQVRDGRSPDPRLEAYLKSAEDCFNQMNASASAAAQVQPLNTDQQQIVKVGQELHDSMDKLQSKFVELHLDQASKRGLRGKMLMAKKTLKSLWQSKELGSLEENLKRYESLLHGVVLHRICNQSQAAEIKSTEAFNELNTNLQSFIAQLADGRTKLSELLLTSLEIRDRVTQEHEKTRKAMDRGFTSTQGTISGICDSMSQRFQDSTQRELSRDLEKHHEQLLESLRFSDMNRRRNQVSENYPGTFSWVFKNTRYDGRSHSLSDEETDNEEKDEEDEKDDITMDDTPESAPTTDAPNINSFPAWLESDLNLFWISGKPASGKSSLMKFLALNSLTMDHLKVWQRNMQMTDRKLHIITHFFWKPGQLLQRNIEGMMLSLLYQVLQKDPYLARRLWEDQENVSEKRARGDWDLNELREALCYAIKSSSDAFCIFLDGLDEAKELESLSWRDKRKTQVIHDLLWLSNVKLCASSREEHPFCLFFDGRPRLRIHQLTYHDIYHFVENKLEVAGLSSSYRHHILKIVVEKANGVFLWVVLVLDSLNRAIRSGTASYNEYEERLAQTPADLNDLLIDMWERPGDDAKLPSYRIDASRYFSLAITAKKLDEDMEVDLEVKYKSPDHNSMRSLLVMATALEDAPLTSILDTGRDIQAKDLQARCARVADRLRLISRGLLEIAKTPIADDVDYFEGNPRLIPYDTKRIDFIHRSAFDFITDTQFGRECLSTCDWSPVEQVDRLLGGHLVKCRFLCFEPPWYTVGMTTDKMIYKMINQTSIQLHAALKITYYDRWGDLSSENRMLRILKDWQESGLFCAHSYYNYPQGSKTPSNLLELEFLEQIVETAPRFFIIAGILDGFSIGPLIDAIPVLLRAAVDGSSGAITDPGCWDLVGYILTRLTNTNSEERQGVSSQARANEHSVFNRQLGVPLYIEL
ncbi:Ff.00g062420.m01.CDS01 [Fusarium sp. VM40]|nr:Ff.00g062420.m01.CDS01 [Fusarium sp. VM40]